MKNLSISFLLFLIFSVGLYGSIEAQVFHIDDINDVVGIIVSTPINKPQTWPKDSTFVGGKSLEKNFHDFFVGKPDNINARYPNNWDANETYTTLRVPKRIRATLEVRRDRKMLILFHNGGYEGSRSYLTLWDIYGDSLHFNTLWDEAFSAGLGYVAFEENFMVDIYDNLIVVLKGSGGDEGSVFQSYSFIQISRKNSLHKILKKEFGSSYNYPTGTEHLILYKILGKKDLLLQEYWYDITTESAIGVRGGKYRLSNRTLRNSKYDLIDLRTLIIKED